MKEKTLFKIAMVCSVLGLVALFFVSEYMPIKKIDAGNITDEDVDAEVRVFGKVERVSDTEKVMFLKVGQLKVDSVSVVLFKEGNVSVKEGDYVELIGTVSEYNGEKSIIANAVKVR